MKKLMMFLMIAIPLVVVIIVNLTTTAMRGEAHITVDNITLSETYAIANVGESEKLTYHITPENATNKDVIWSSDNEQVALVDNTGRVEFVGFGRAHITATTLDGSKSDQCYFYVTDTKVHQVVLTSAQNYVHINKTLQLTATVLPYEAVNRNVTFSSSNPGVASVDTNGRVTGISAGYTTITATSEDGGLQGVFDLQVWHPVSDIKAAKHEIVTSSASEQITFEVQPAMATNKSVSFSVDRPEIAEVSPSGLITFKHAGEVDVTITTVDGGFSDTVKYIYTDGYAYDFTLTTTSITMTVGDADVYLDYNLIPANVSKTTVEFVSDNEEVAYILNERYLHAAKGGGTLVRARVHKSADEIIEKEILVTVQSPATALAIDDVITATNTYQLMPESLPEDSTNETYFYHIDEKYSTLANVTENGLVAFLTDNPCTIELTIYANEDFGDVFKTIKVTFTAGKASSFDLLEHDVTVKNGEVVNLNYSILPANANAPIQITLMTSTPTLANGKVVEILDNKIIAVGGGKATVKLQTTLYDNKIVEEICNITVLVDVTKIDINLDIDYFNNQYVTAEKEVDFAGEVYPKDATDQNIVWTVNNQNLAMISGNKLQFKQVGVVTLTATIGNVSNSVEIYYTSSTPIYAEIKAMMGQDETEIPKKVMAGESFDVVLSKIIPSNNKNATLSIEIRNQRPILAGKVLEASGNKVSALTSGSATLVVYVSGSLRFSFNLVVEKLPESITVTQANSTVTAQTVELMYNVLPADASNKEVKFVVNNPDVAEITGSTLTFKKNGIAQISVYCLAKEDVKLDFTIEKVENSAKIISTDQTNVIVNKGDILAFELSGDYTISILDSQPLIKGQEVAKVDGKYLKTVGAGKVKIQISKLDKNINMDIEIRQLVEKINLISDIDFVDNEYVFASNFVDLEFEILPTYAFNSAVKISITEQISTDGVDNNFAYIVGKRIYFTNAGSAVIQVDSVDGNATAIFHLQHTGGDAIDAQLNVGETCVLQVGEQKEIRVESWLPKDTENTFFVLLEDAISSNKVISIDNKTKTITALHSGETKLIVELSNGITKEIDIKVTKKVSDLDVQENVLTASERYTIVANALPADATDKTLEFELLPTDIATIEENVLYFKKPGTVKVTIKATDGSGVQKTITVTSTKGFLNKIELESTTLTLNKNDSASLGMIKYPTDAPSNDVQFKILSSLAADGSDKEVITLLSDGTIEARYGGTAIVRVFSHNFDGEEIYADCNITVLSPLESFDVTFDHQMEYYQSAYITSRKEISFTTSFQPQDALVRTFKFEISNDVAKIEGNKIIFTQVGRVTIKMTSDDFANGEKSKNFTFFYTKDNLLEASLSKLGIENGVINLKAGENFKFTLSHAIPDDNQNLTFSIKNMEEARVDLNKSVAHFENDTIYADHGGNVTFDLYVNNLLLEQITVIVLRDATDIDILGDQQVYISQISYTIEASVYPSDSTQNKLGYSTSNEEIATVSANGVVAFKGFGIVKITVYVIGNPNISKIITIQYTKELQSIQFNSTRDKMFVDDYVDLNIIAQPYDAEEFEYEMTIDNTNIARLDKQANGYRLKGLNKQGGEVTVTAKVIGKDISVKKTFTFFEKIRDINLQLDATGDNYGQGGYRVFGNSFIGENNTIVHTYQMNVNLLPSNNLKNLLVWTSNNQDVAQVDQNGLVTFLSAGKATISVSQIAPYEGALVTKDSYQFTIVDGINVENYNQFEFAHNKLNNDNADKNENYSYLVLHKNIVIENKPENSVIKFGYNVCGNGYMLDHSQIESTGEIFVVEKNNVQLDNVVLRGCKLKENAKLTELKDSGTTLIVRNCTGVLLYNTVLENGKMNLLISCSTVEISGCILTNSALAGIRIEHINGATSTVTVQDSIFANSLFAGVIFNPIKNVGGQEDKLILKGQVRFYNWSTMDNIIDGFMTEIERKLKELNLNFVTSELIKQVKDIVAKNDNLAYEYNGTTYYHFGVANVGIPDIGYGSNGSFDRTNLNPSFNYNNASMSGAINFGVVSFKIVVEGLTFTNPTPFIKPGQSYTDNKEIALAIKQPCRF